MAKTIKFNLVCDQKPVRTIEDLQNNFSIEDVLAYYNNGLLARWLEVRGYEEELEKVKAITETEDYDIIEELIEIFGVAADDDKVEEDIYILDYLQERRESLERYREENWKMQSIIEDYAAGYQDLVDELLEYPDSIASIKECIKMMVKDYSWVLKMDHRSLFYTLTTHDGWLALMCMLMVDECRKYYLPIEKKDTDGKVVLDISTDGDKKSMYGYLCNFVRSAELMKKKLGDDLHSFAGITDGYWKDLEPKGKKLMIISMENGDFVRSAGNRDEEFSSSDIKEKFLILDGIDYKSNDAGHTLFYMEV